MPPLLPVLAVMPADLPTLLASLPPAVLQEVALAIAALVTLLGAWLCWTAPRHRMSVEERAKDGLISEDDARRKMRLRSRLGPALVIVGVLALGWVVLT
jgi:hypothetical protein